jgi:Asp-tRNA(Asn)/Glu-tRNA(Gln) amidotransferase A subunit family amidase
MRFEEYRKHDAISLAGLIAKREVSAEEVLETAIARAEQVNPALNAIVHKQYEQGAPGGRGGASRRAAEGRALPYQRPRLLRNW